MRSFSPEGEKLSYDDPVFHQWREYRLARLFGWTPDEIDAAPGHWCDWAIAISKVDGG